MADTTSTTRQRVEEIVDRWIAGERIGVRFEPCTAVGRALLTILSVSSIVVAIFVVRPENLLIAGIGGLTCGLLCLAAGAGIRLVENLVTRSRN